MFVERRKSTRADRREQPDAQALREVFQALPSTAALVLAPDPPRYTIVEVTDAYLAATCRQRGELLGRPLFEALPEANPADPEPSGAAHLRASLERVLSTRASHAMDVTRFDVACADGHWEERWWAPDNVPVPGTEGQVRAILHHVRDVTAQVLADRAVQAAEQRAAAVRVQAEAELEAESRRQELFIATLSHELRNPLAPVRTGLHILRLGGSDSPAGSRALQTMDRQLAHLVHLLDDLLDVSRISHGQVQLRVERMRLQLLLEQAVEAATPSLQAHHFHADLCVQDATVEGDRTRLLQVVDNLLHNAAKYTPPGGSIRLAARVEGGEAVVQVQDDGIGIEPGHLARIFEPFTQLGTPCSDPSRAGLGIGLSIARKLVQMHHGSLQADSAGPGKGSTFTLRLPLART